MAPNYESCYFDPPMEYFEMATEEVSLKDKFQVS